jgi:CHAT domain-containing protein
MSYFYSEIKKGNSAGQAMREAQLKLMKEYPNPN